MTVTLLRAPAKLTTSLRITGVRDDGLHEIDAEMITVDLYDDLVVDPGGSGLAYSESGEVARPAGIAPGADLVERALELVGVRAAVEVTKRIPAGAGLGGGSADAAAVLRWAGYRDLDGAASIGADVAFCLVGGRARVRGIGELVEPLPFVPQTFTVLTPPVHCSTAEVYAMWDALGGPQGANGNDLEPAALAVEPSLALARDALARDTGETPRLAGSGSSWFVPGSHPHAGRVINAVPADRRSA